MKLKSAIKFFQLDSLLLFSLENPDVAKVGVFKSNLFLEISPFVYLLDKFTIDDLNLLRNHFNGYYFIPRKDNSELWSQKATQIFTIQERAQFSQYQYLEQQIDLIIQSIPKDVSIQEINEVDFNRIKNEKVFLNHFQHYSNFQEFSKKFGTAVTIKRDQEFITVISSFVSTQDQIEIQVDTLPEERKKGFAKIASAYFLKVLNTKSLTPHWDAATEISKQLGEKLGFSNPIKYFIVF